MLRLNNYQANTTPFENHYKNCLRFSIINTTTTTTTTTTTESPTIKRSALGATKWKLRNKI